MSSPARAPCPYCPESRKQFTIPHGLRVHIGRKHKEVISQDLPASLAVTSANIGGLQSPNCTVLHDLTTLKLNVRVLRHVPKGARCLAAGKLTELIEKCLNTNSTEDWFSVLSFAYRCLRIPERSDKKSLTAKVKENVINSQIEQQTETGAGTHLPLYRLVEAKVHDGDLKGAARLLTSDCSLAPSNEDTLKALRDKHPAPSRLLDNLPTPNRDTPALVVKVEDVSSAIASFGRGSAAGLDGLRPDHLKELTSPSAGDKGQQLLKSLTRLCNFLLEGTLNVEVCPYLYGGSLCALTKKDGGVRPIAVGNTLRRLVAKLCCHAVKNDMASYLQPLQVGFGTPLGCEAAIHSTRSFAMRESNNVIIKLDLRNAFNSIERDCILAEVRSLTPSIFPFLFQCYSAPSKLSFSDTNIDSQVGAQQGDPLGPLIFSMAIHKAISSLEAPLNVWYLDDGTIGGSPDTIERDVIALFPALKELGLEVNTSKCEFFGCSEEAKATYTRFARLIPGLKRIEESTFTLLGAPIFAEGVRDCLISKTSILKSLAAHFNNLPAHISLTLLRSCFAMPKLTYVVRTAPTWLYAEQVQNFDNALKSILEETLNVCLTEVQWNQASLPVRHGGLGVRRLLETGPIAFLASAWGAAELVTRITGIPLSEDATRIPFTEGALEAWSTLSPGVDLPENPGRQKCWDDATCKVSMSNLLLQARGGVDSARLKAASLPESGAWLHALPSPHMGTLLDDDSLRVAVGLRLGSSICEPHVCICGSRVEADGHHGLSCLRSAGRRPRHYALNEVIKRALVSANVPCTLEPPGLSRSDGKRPDGLTLIPWQRGRCLIWDATCVCTFASCHLPGTQQTAGAGAETAARNKHSKYADLESTYDFVPFAVETAGSWGTEAKKLIQDIGDRLRKCGGDPRSGHFLRQQISIAIQRGNAASIMGTFGRGSRQESNQYMI